MDGGGRERGGGQNDDGQTPGSCWQQKINNPGGGSQNMSRRSTYNKLLVDHTVEVNATLLESCGTVQSLTKVLLLIHFVETTANKLTFNESIGFRNGSYES